VAAINWLGLLQPQDESLPAQPGGCANCHPGLGAKPNLPPTEEDLQNVDCLICHGPDYRRTVVKDEDGSFRLAPAEGVDVTASAQAAGRPTSEMCTRCHLGAAGGPNYKHGDYPTSPEVDVHLAAGLQCVDCHLTENHQIAGGGYMIAQELTEVVVACENCHNEEPHRTGMDALLNRHTERVACQTCHIPLLARDPAYPTQMTRDYTQPVYNEATGLYGPAVGLESNVVPTYFWWDSHRMETPPKPIGSLDDPGAKITPWKPLRVTVPVDAETASPVYIKQGVYQVTGDLDAAVSAGVEASGQEYSGAWEAVTERMYFDANHQVAPASEALACADCHSGEGQLDFVALGYDEVRAALLQGLAGPATPGETVTAGPGRKPAGLSNAACLACHDEPGLTMELASGELLYLTVDGGVYEQSVHGQQGLACVQCHTEITQIPHDPLPDYDRRDLLVRSYYTTCAGCHADKYRETLDNVHQRELAAGNNDAAICSDCHGAHDVTTPGEPHSRTSQMCEQCHSEIYNLYHSSVHGAALIDEGNPDVPSCTDCHGVHRLEGPSTEAAFHLASHGICERCHSDPAVMDRYGLNADVYDTYVADFHGSTVVLYEALMPGEETNKPVCVDCHGVHDIRSHDEPQSHVIKENLLETCQRCHPNATTDFPDSWLSHYRPDLEKTPLVFFVDIFYKILIPATLGFMVVFNITDIGRSIADRVKRRREANHD
jgi:hypothetical protein